MPPAGPSAPALGLAGSTVAKSYRMAHLRKLALAMARHSFVVDCDLEDLGGPAVGMLSMAQDDIHYQVLNGAPASQLLLD